MMGDNIGRDIRDIVSMIAEQKDGHRENLTYDLMSALYREKLVPELPVWWFEERGKTVPWENWTAAEIALYDNRLGQKRARIDRPAAKGRMKTATTLFAGRIKFWGGKAETFDSRRAPHHQFVIHYFERANVERLMAQLRKEGNEAYVRSIADHVEQFRNSEVDARLGLVRAMNGKRNGAYIHGVTAVSTWVDGTPDAFVLMSGEGHGINGAYVFENAVGHDLISTTVATARLSSLAGALGDWAS